MKQLPGYKSYAEFSRTQGLTRSKVSMDMSQGYCQWPRRQNKGLRKHPYYGSYRAMKYRCTNPNASDYRWYGALGITVSPEWLCSFEQFLLDMGPKPDPTYTVDRINPLEGYSKENCRWASIKTQRNNTRSHYVCSR